MNPNEEKVKVIGKNILVQKERIDAGGIKLTPTLEEDGQKNYGTIIGVGQIPFLMRMRGVKLGAKVIFKKFFIANDGQKDARVFVECENIIAIIL